MPAPLDGLVDKKQKPADPAPVEFRAWNDFDKTRDAIYKNALDGVTERNLKSENNTHRLEIVNLKYEDKVPSLEDEHNAISSKHSLGRKLLGTYRLTDKLTGQVISERPDELIAKIPHMTKRGTFIRNGSEYVLFNQQRLKPGVYTRLKKSGDYEAQFNVQPGTGRGFRINLEPASGVVKFTVGQGSVRAYPVLKALGYDDAALKKVWGEELWKRNASAKEKGD